MATVYSDSRWNSAKNTGWRIRVDYSGTSASVYVDVVSTYNSSSIWLRFTTGTNTFSKSATIYYSSNNGKSANLLGTIAISETSATTITQTCSGSEWGGTVNGESSVTIPQQKAYFNLNLLEPDGSEPVSSSPGTVDRSINGGAYETRYNEDTNYYAVGTTFNYRNFSPGAGKYLAGVSGVTPNNTTGPWSATLGTGGLTVTFATAWYTYYRDINAWKPGNTEQNGLMFDYYIYDRNGTLVNSYLNQTNEIANTVTREYGYTGKINNIRSNVTGAHYTTNNVTGNGAGEFWWTYNNENAIELYSAWNTYTVNYNGNNATGGSTGSSSHTYNTAKALTSNGFYRNGYDFLGWSTSSSATSPTYTNRQSVSNLTATQNGTVTLYAVWRETIPSNLQINGSATTPFNIDLNWSATGVNITNYTVYYNGVAKNCGTSTSTTLEVSPETTYDIYFTATNAGGTTTSGSISITTPADQAKGRIKTQDGWRRGKIYYKKDGKWAKVKKIYRKVNNQWIIGTNIEPGDLTFWKQSHSGVWNINYNPTTGLSRVVCNGRSGWWEQLYKICSTTVGATYTVSFDYYNPNGYSADYGGIECQASNALENNNGDARKIGYASLGAAANSEIQHLSFTFTASAAETCIAFNFGRGSDTTPVDIYIGNIFITQN